MANRDSEIDALRVDLAALRLTMRGIIGHLLAQSELPIAEAILAFKEAVAKTSPNSAKIPDMDPELHRRASKLA